MIEKRMKSLGWIKEIHWILGKNKIRYHKEGFELPEHLAVELLK